MTRRAGSRQPAPRPAHSAPYPADKARGANIVLRTKAMRGILVVGLVGAALLPITRTDGALPTELSAYPRNRRATAALVRRPARSAPSDMPSPRHEPRHGRVPANAGARLSLGHIAAGVSPRCAKGQE
jgi:hypothetical protein